MAKSFAAQVDAWTAKSKLRMEAVVKTAAQSVANEVTTPIANGGRTPLDTSFMINSFVADIGQMPRGPSDRATEPIGDASAVSLVIARMKMGDTLYAGFGASYSRYMEARFGFVEGAAQKWPQFVNNAITDAMRRIK